MVYTCVDYALDQISEIQAFGHEMEHMADYDLYYSICIIWKEACLGELELYSDPFERISETHDFSKIKSFKRELLFLKMMFWCSATWDWDDDTDANLRSKVTTLEDIWEDFSENIDDNILLKTDVLGTFLEGAIEQSKLLMVDYCYVLLDYSSLQCKPLEIAHIVQFLQLVLHNLEIISPVKLQIDSLKVGLILSLSLFRLLSAHEGTDCEELRALKLCFHTFANKAAALVFLFWANAGNEDLTFEAKIHQIFFDMRQKIIKPCNSNVTAMYMGALKAIKLKPSDETFCFYYEQVVEGLVNLHLDDDLVAMQSKEELGIVREGLIVLLTFVSSPPEGSNQDEHELLAFVYNQIDLVFSKCTYVFLSPHLIENENFTLRKMLFNDFAEKVEETMEKVKALYVKVPDSSSYNFPKTNGLGFYHFLLENLGRLKEKLDSDTTFLHLAKDSIIKIDDELVSLRPLVNGMFELQKEQMEFEETWSQLINLAYRIEHVINSCCVRIHPIWYNMASLSVILNQIQDVKAKLKKVDAKGKFEEVGNWKIHHANVLPGSLQSSSAPLEMIQFPLNNEGGVISLKEETSKIVDELTGGYASLSIISIIGMGGLGKSTLAKAVCNSKKVRHHFHKVAWGSVSQVLNKKKFFVEILCGINNSTRDKFDSMTEDDLAHHLWKCLSGQMYLIVVDDLWDIKAWDAVKSSFPDDKNGSRVIFTTRELKVSLDVKSSCHNLRPLFDDESFQLLHMKVFGKGDCPSYVSELGKVIARNCKGLPLSLVVAAGLLAINKTSSSWWKEIADTTCQFVGKECKQIIGYSYKHLPEHLKSCFLYMGLYEEDELIVAKKLRRLWIGEGFVNKSTTKSLRIMAKEYLRDLANRNLVTTIDSTCKGEIRTCRLHDLIGDFCRRQVEEDKFLWMRDGYAAFHSSNFTIRNLYRVSVQGSFDEVEPRILGSIHSLIEKNFGVKSGLNKFILEKLKLVQVLHLEGHTESIILNHLVHLRHLSVDRWHGKVLESICKFWKLETLVLQTNIESLKLPKTIWKMKMLRHLECPRGCEFDLDFDDKEECKQLLDNLQFLSNLWLYDKIIARAVLQRLPNLQKLTCSLTGSEWIAKAFTIDFLHNLESLTLHSFTVDLHVSFPLALKRVNFCAWVSCSEDLLSAIGELPYVLRS